MAGGKGEEEEVAMVTNPAKSRTCPLNFLGVSLLPLVFPLPLPPFFLHLRKRRDKVILGELSWQI